VCVGTPGPSHADALTVAVVLWMAQLTQMMTDKSQLECNGSLPEHWGAARPCCHCPSHACVCARLIGAAVDGRTVTYYSCADVKIVGTVPVSQFQYAGGGGGRQGAWALMRRAMVVARQVRAGLPARLAGARCAVWPRIGRLRRR
jgi:hypothetical protein